MHPRLRSLKPALLAAVISGGCALPCAAQQVGPTGGGSSAAIAGVTGAAGLPAGVNVLRGPGFQPAQQGMAAPGAGMGISGFAAPGQVTGGASSTSSSAIRSANLGILASTSLVSPAGMPLTPTVSTGVPLTNPAAPTLQAISGVFETGSASTVPSAGPGVPLNMAPVGIALNSDLVNTIALAAASPATAPAQAMGAGAVTPLHREPSAALPAQEPANRPIPSADGVPRRARADRN